MGESYLGRGLEPIAGKPFGYAHAMEREEIKAHLLKRGLVPGPYLNMRIVKIQERLHRNAPSYRERHAAWLAKQPASFRREPFTAEELSMIAERFAGSNDPIGQSIARKAS